MRQNHAMLRGHERHRNRAMRHLLWTIFFVAMAGTPALACSKPSNGGASGKAISISRPNQAVFDQALLAWANYERCRKGLPELAPNSGLRKAAGTHSQWMARAGRLSHTSTVAGQQKLKGRFRSNGVSFRTGAENIATWERFQFPTGQFRVLNAARCRYATQAGRAIPAHSYGSLAQAVVSGWMGSSGHRRNLLNRRITSAGGGLAIDRNGGHCGRIYITQDYAG